MHVEAEIEIEEEEEEEEPEVETASEPRPGGKLRKDKKGWDKKIEQTIYDWLRRIE